MTQRLPWLINLLLCLLLGAIVAFGVKALQSPLPSATPELARVAEIAVAVDRAPEARLLGADVSGGVVPPAVQVLGVVAGDRYASAVLSIEGRPAMAYRLGDELINGWALSDVAVDEILIERSGRSARIRVPERSSVQGMITTEPATPSVR